MAQRIAEADAFYEVLQHDVADADHRLVQRQALAGHDLEQAVLLLRRARSGWTATRRSRRRRRSAAHGRNREWMHLNNADIISMPDKWEYPWYAAWDLAFHCIPLALVDPEFAKEQLVLLTREWYMHPNGQIPAYEWAFGDVNPPVHAWATWRVFQIDRKQRGDAGDLAFLERVFHKLHAQLHLVGQPQGRRGPQRLPGRLPGPRQHRRLRPQRAACPPAATSTSPTAPAGWRCTALNLMRIALELARAQPRLRGHRHQVLRALPAHRRGDDRTSATRASGCGTTRTSSSTTCCTCPTAG